MSRAASSHINEESQELKVLHVKLQNDEYKKCERVYTLDKYDNLFMYK